MSIGWMGWPAIFTREYMIIDFRVNKEFVANTLAFDSKNQWDVEKNHFRSAGCLGPMVLEYRLIQGRLKNQAHSIPQTALKRHTMQGSRK